MQDTADNKLFIVLFEFARSAILQKNSNAKKT